MNIHYELRGGHWNFKDEVKMSFYYDLYEFVKREHPEAVSGITFDELVISEPYIIGNTLGKFYLKEVVGGTIEAQPTTHFIGYCHHEKKYLELIPHLITFFALWREIEGCSEANATDFFASSWASLVDTAKFFKYTTVEELKVSPEAPSVQDARILESIQNCPEQYPAPTSIALHQEVKIPSPRKTGFKFLGWYKEPQCQQEKVTSLVGTSVDATLYAKWGSYTLFHANDGYLTFEDIYDDFIKDFNTLLPNQISKNKERMGEHGWVSDFCKASSGVLNRFFHNPVFYKKWQWLITYVSSLYQSTPELAHDFDFIDGAFVNEEHVRWELNSLFVSRYHLVYPKTKDYSGAGIKERLADSTNSFLIRVDYVIGEAVQFPKVSKPGEKFMGWYSHPVDGTKIKTIHDDTYAAKTIYARWQS
ncbi:MAG: InlB B-repeat-containing protein [Bacilli bacterium]|nr:InlB B-repeat-containing protein [Bacilli bacterium]